MARFWDHGRWWKALVLAVGYLAIHEPASLLMAPFLPVIGDEDSTSYVLLLIVVPVLIGGFVLVGFGATVGWLRSTFERQPIRGRGWMWISIVVVLLFTCCGSRASTTPPQGSTGSPRGCSPDSSPASPKNSSPASPKNSSPAATSSGSCGPRGTRGRCRPGLGGAVRPPAREQPLHRSAARTHVAADGLHVLLRLLHVPRVAGDPHDPRADPAARQHRPQHLHAGHPPDDRRPHLPRPARQRRLGPRRGRSPRRLPHLGTTCTTPRPDRALRSSSPAREPDGGRA